MHKSDMSYGDLGCYMVDLEEKSYYEILGVPFNASVEEIKEAYRGIARAFHPDSNFYDEIIQDKDKKGVPDQEAFKKITEAYNTLINEERRKEYDKLFPKGLRDWDDIERNISKEEFKILHVKTDSQDDLVGTIYRPRKHTGTFTSGTFGALQRETEELESAVDSALRGRSITPMEIPAERNLLPWFVLLLVFGFVSGGILAYWLVTR